MPTPVASVPVLYPAPPIVTVRSWISAVPATLTGPRIRRPVRCRGSRTGGPVYAVLTGAAGAPTAMERGSRNGRLGTPAVGHRQRERERGSARAARGDRERQGAAGRGAAGPGGDGAVGGRALRDRGVR